MALAAILMTSLLISALQSRLATSLLLLMGTLPTHKNMLSLLAMICLLGDIFRQTFYPVLTLTIHINNKNVDAILRLSERNVLRSWRMLFLNSLTPKTHVLTPTLSF